MKRVLIFTTLLLSSIFVSISIVFAYPAVDCDGEIVVDEFANRTTLNYRLLERGYCNHLSYWVNGMISEWTYFFNIPPNQDSSGTPVAYRGNATWYDLGVMENSANTNGVDLGGCTDGVAVMFGRPIGQGFAYNHLWIKRAGQDHFEQVPYCVADSSDREDVWGNVIHNGAVIEVGNATAQRWGLISYDAEGNLSPDPVWKEVNVEVYFGDSLPENYIVVDYVDWWVTTASFQYNGRVVNFNEILGLNPNPPNQ